MKLNCDLGESYGAWKMPVENDVMKFLDQANIACGFHGGDPVTLQNSIALAKKHGVSVGAHPSYPDLQGFGRRSMAMEANELVAAIQYQVSALSGMAAIQGVTLDYVKPHGALYNDMMKDMSIYETVLTAMRDMQLCSKGLALMIQAVPEFEAYEALASQYDVSILFEAFSDRRYTSKGRLTPRTQDGAVLDSQEAIEQAQHLVSQGTIIASDGTSLSLKVDSLCVHGDTPDAVSLVKRIRQLINTN